jgi:hypothetical protein
MLGQYHHKFLATALDISLYIHIYLVLTLTFSHQHAQYHCTNH